MDYKGEAYILAMITALGKLGSWTGKTIIQKALHIVDARQHIQLPFRFILYMHGPYSFDVDEVMQRMKVFGVLKVEPMRGRGTMLLPGPGADFVTKANPLSDNELAEIECVAKLTANKSAAELERLATAVWIRMRENITNGSEVADRLVELKPHVEIEAATAAAGEAAAALSA